MENERTNPGMLEKELQSAQLADENLGELTFNYPPARKKKSIWRRPVTYIIAGALLAAGAIASKCAYNYLNKHLLDNASFYIDLS